MYKPVIPNMNIPFSNSLDLSCASGSSVGSAVGAAAGSLVPGVGTVIGGLVGGLTGSLFGRKSSKWSSATDQEKDQIANAVIYQAIYIAKQPTSTAWKYIHEYMKANGFFEGREVDYTAFWAANDWFRKRVYAAFGLSSNGATVVDQNVSNLVSKVQSGELPAPSLGGEKQASQIAAGLTQNTEGERSFEAVTALKNTVSKNKTVVYVVSAIVIVAIIIAVIYFIRKKK